MAKTTALIRVSDRVLEKSRRDDENPALVYINSLRAGPGRESMKAALGDIASRLLGGAFSAPRVQSRSERTSARQQRWEMALALPWHRLRYQHTQKLRAELIDCFSTKTVNRYLSAVRGVLREAWNLKLMKAEDYQRALQVKTVKGQRLPPGRSLSIDEIDRLIRACKADVRPAGKRDAAIIAMMATVGPRRSEVVGLDLSDFRRHDGELRIREAKGNKDRRVPIVDGNRSHLDEWIAVRGEWSGPLFAPISKAGRVLRQQLSDQAIRFILMERARQAGVENFTPHDLRRTCATTLIDRGAPLSVVAEMLGHASTDTTKGYDRSGFRAIQKAAALFVLNKTQE